LIFRIVENKKDKIQNSKRQIQDKIKFQNKNDNLDN